MLNITIERPIRKKAATHTTGWLSQHATTSTANAWAQQPATVIVLLHGEMRRNSSRHGGAGFADASSRPAGSTSGSMPATGTMVVAMTPSYNFSTHDGQP